MFNIKVFAFILSTPYVLGTPINTPPPTGISSLHVGAPGGAQLALGVPSLGAQGPSPQLTPANIPTIPINLPLPPIHAQLPILQLNLGPASFAAGPTIGLDLDQNGLSANIGAGAGAGVGGNNFGASAGTGFALGSSGISVGADAGAIAGPQLVGAGAQAGVSTIDSETVIASAGAETVTGPAAHPSISSVGAQLPLNGAQIQLQQQGAQLLPSAPLTVAVSTPLSPNPIRLSLAGAPAIVNLGGHPYLALSFMNGQILLAPSQISQLKARSSPSHQLSDCHHKHIQNNDRSIPKSDNNNQYLYSHKKFSKMLKNSI